MLKCFLGHDAAGAEPRYTTTVNDEMKDRCGEKAACNNVDNRQRIELAWS